MQKRCFFHLAFLLFVVPLLLAGCRGLGDTVYFDRRTAAIAGPLPEATVTGAIKAVPGVVLEPTRVIEPYSDWGLYTGVEHNRGGRMYSYHTADAIGDVRVSHTQAKGWELDVTCGWMGGDPASGDLQRSRQLNDRVYLNLRRRVPSLPPLDQARKNARRP